MQHANPRDVDRTRAALHQRLQDYVDLVMAFADEGPQ
jgi:hypothetical protein